MNENIFIRDKVEIEHESGNGYTRRNDGTLFGGYWRIWTW